MDIHVKTQLYDCATTAMSSTYVCVLLNVMTPDFSSVRLGFKCFYHEYDKIFIQIFDYIDGLRVLGTIELPVKNLETPFHIKNVFLMKEFHEFFHITLKEYIMEKYSTWGGLNLDKLNFVLSNDNLGSLLTTLVNPRSYEAEIWKTRFL